VTQRHRRVGMNGVRYLRVENGNIVELGRRVMQNMYSVPAGGELGLMVQGISWHGQLAPSG
jgi:hypothetical protein